MTDILVPKIDANETTYTLLEWACQDGRYVSEGEPVALIETSKTICDICAPQSGVLHHTLKPGSECTVGERIGHVFASDEERLNFLVGQNKEPDLQHQGTSAIITDAARELAQRSGISDDVLRSLGGPVVRRSDVERIINHVDLTSPRAQGAGTLQVTRLQQAIAETVSRSHAAIPAAFTVVKIYTDTLTELSAALSQLLPVPSGLPEILIKAIASCCDRFPVFFAVRDEQGLVHLPSAAHVAVTVDVGSGLYTPVVKDADSRTLADIVALLADFRKCARDQRFRDEYLRGGNILLALHNYTGIEFAVPLIFPGYTCAISLGGTQAELHLDARGQVAARRFALVGIAYDHRLVNGRNVVLLARELKTTMENRERLQALVS